MSRTAHYSTAFLLTLLMLSTTIGNLGATVSFTPVNYGSADANEADAFDRINDFRADPQNELYEMFQEQGYSDTKANFDALLATKTSYTSNEGWWTTNFGSNLATNSMNFYATVPSTLLSQFSSLPASLTPYTWSDNVGWAAHQYSVWVEADAGNTSNPHSVTGAPGLGDRFTNAGVNWTGVGENIARDWPLNVALMHMGFAIDWGTGTDGIQNPPGHRNSMLSSSYSHIGIGFFDDPDWNPGNYTQVQHFAIQSSTDPIFYGYVTDAGGPLSGTSVELYDSNGNPLGTTTTDARGAYTIQYSGGTPDYATYGGITSNVALGNSGLNYYLDAVIPEPSSVTLILIGILFPTLRRRR